MTQTLRHPEILHIAKREGKVTVEQLATHFGVTLQTIRRDLTELAAAKKLERVHGGAVMPSGTSNIEYDERRNLNNDAKRSIARACAAQVPDGASVFINIGTSTEAVARHLLGHKDLLVVTNNMNVASILADNARCETILTGGKLRHADNGLVGNIAIGTIRQFKFDFAVVGCSAMDIEGDLFDYDIEEVGVSKAIIEQSRCRFLVADSSKFSRTAPARIASLRSLSAVFTDKELPDVTARKCESWQTDIVIAQ